MPSGVAGGTWPLVGRDSQLEEIGRAVRGHTFGGLVIVGDAGLGKTRLAAEVLAAATSSGYRTARVAATRASLEIPLGALSPLLGANDVGAAGSDVLAEARAALRGDDDRPVLLSVDDAHWLDSVSATVIHQAALHDSVVMILTVRSGEPAPDPVSALWKDDIAQRLDLAALSPTDVRRLLEMVLEGPVEGGTTDELWRVSEGNPLYLRELVLGALDSHLLVRREGVWTLDRPIVASPRLVELVGARLADLGEGERSVLEYVAFGEPVGVALLAHVADIEAMESLEAKGLLQIELDGRRRLVRLDHPVHGEVIRETIPALRAMAVQRRLVEATQRFGGRRRDDVMRIAVLGVASGYPVDPALLLRAAKQARVAGHLDVADRLGRAAHAAEPTIEATRFVAEVCESLGDHTEAVDLLRPILTAGETDDDRALVAMTLADSLFWGMGDHAGARSVLGDAIDAVDSLEWQMEMIGQRASHDLLSGRPLDALAVVEPVLGELSGRALVQACTVAVPALAVVGRADDGLAVGDRAIVARTDLGDQPILADVDIHVAARSLALSELGRLRDAEEVARAGYDTAVRLHERESRAWFALMLGRCTYVSRPATAAAWFREAAMGFGTVNQPGPRRWSLAGVLLSACYVGDMASAAEASGAIDAIGAPHMGLMESDVRRAEGWWRLASGNRSGAIDALHDAADVAASSGSAALELAALHDLVRIDAFDDEPRFAQVASVVSGDLAAARAAHAKATIAQDANELSGVAATFERLGAHVLSAEAWAQASAVHSRAGAVKAATRCARQSADLGAVSGRLATPAVMLAGAGAALTRREREVAQLAADGRSNKEIAEELVVSSRTVGNHLAHVYEKLGISGREEIGEALGPLA